MNFSLVYLASRLLYRIKEFLRHWYIGSFLVISHQVFNILEKLDRRLALRITLRNFLRPLYQDYSVLGYILGFFFRSWRIIIASVIYLAIIAVALAVYIFWALIPIYIIASARLS